MSSYTLLMVLLVLGLALLANRFIRHPIQAGYASALCSALPNLVLFDLGGGSRTDFAFFNLFMLFLLSLAGSALVGAVIYFRRKQRNEAMAWAPIPKKISWPLLVGPICAVSLRLMLIPDAAEVSALRILLLSLVLGTVIGLFVGLFVNLIFNASAGLAGWSGPSARFDEFLIGVLIGMVLVLLHMLTELVVPPEWDRDVHRLSFALNLNGLFFATAVIGVLYGRRVGDHAKDATVVQQGMMPAAPTDALEAARQRTQRSLWMSLMINVPFAWLAIVAGLRDHRLAVPLGIAFVAFWGAAWLRRHRLQDIAGAGDIERMLFRFGFPALYLAVMAASKGL